MKWNFEYSFWSPMPATFACIRAIKSHKYLCLINITSTDALTSMLIDEVTKQPSKAIYLNVRREFHVLLLIKTR